MMKPRSSRVVGEQASSGGARNKPDSLAVSGSGGGGGQGVMSAQVSGGGAGGRNQAQLALAQQQQVANSQAAIRKRRSSINVYDQPSSLNSRLRQLETDMLRLDEDRSKLHDDTHAVLAQYELRLSEIHAILKSRQDNVDKYVEDMRSLLLAKEEFERQTKLLNEKHDRIHEKFMHRETTISREIKLLKNKFELLEKSRQFRSILQKSSSGNLSANLASDLSTAGEDSLALDPSELQRVRGGAGETDLYSGLDRNQAAGLQQSASASQAAAAAAAAAASRGGNPAKRKSVHIKLSKLHTIGRLIAPLFDFKRSDRIRRRRNNRVSSVSMPNHKSATSSSNDDDHGYNLSKLQEQQLQLQQQQTGATDQQQQQATTSTSTNERGDANNQGAISEDKTAGTQGKGTRKKRRAGLFERLMFIR